MDAIRPRLQRVPTGASFVRPCYENKFSSQGLHRSRRMAWSWDLSVSSGSALDRWKVLVFRAVALLKGPFKSKPCRSFSGQEGRVVQACFWACEEASSAAHADGRSSVGTAILCNARPQATASALPSLPILPVKNTLLMFFGGIISMRRDGVDSEWFLLEGLAHFGCGRRLR